MIIEETMTYEDKIYHLKYSDLDSFDNIPDSKWKQVYGICFYKDQIVVGRNEKKDKWNLIGGTREEGESIEQTLSREVEEESNMRVISWLPIGAQYVAENDNYQLRTVCLVEPIGEFESDPSGSVASIDFIDPQNFGQHIPWGKIGKRLLQRALERKLHLSTH